MAASTTPTRIDNRIRRKATESGEPPRKRLKPPSGAAGNSLVSLGIQCSPAMARAASYYGWEHMGNPSAAARCDQNFICVVLQHPLQRFQPVGLARRLVPA